MDSIPTWHKLSYRILRPFQNTLLQAIGSIRTAAILSLSWGILQLIVLAGSLALILIWHFQRLKDSSHLCGSWAILDLRLSTVTCFFKWAVPGNLAIIPLFGLIVWPLCLVVSSLRLIMISDTKSWSFLPALHAEIAQIQAMTMIAFLRFTHFCEINQLLKGIAPHFPPEIVNAIVSRSEMNARSARIKSVRRLVYRPTKKVPEMDKKAWLIQATHFATFPRTELSSFMSEYLVFVHPVLDEHENTWIAVFSRDAALISGIVVFYVSLLYMRWVYAQGPEPEQ